MCGRYNLITCSDALVEHFKLQQPVRFQSSYNITPAQKILTIVELEDQSKKSVNLFWGLVPSWAKDVKIGAKMINARSETILEKASFRTAFSRRRCLVPATSFFEWKQDKVKKPYVIKLVGGEIFSMAGIWEKWKSPEGLFVNSFSIITTEANSAMQALHHRMPVILSKQNENVWLSDLPVDELFKLLQPCPDEWLDIYQVSDLVNAPKNDVPEILLPVSPG